MYTAGTGKMVLFVPLLRWAVVGMKAKGCCIVLYTCRQVQTSVWVCFSGLTFNQNKVPTVPAMLGVRCVLFGMRVMSMFSHYKRHLHVTSTNVFLWPA